MAKPPDEKQRGDHEERKYVRISFLLHLNLGRVLGWFVCRFVRLLWAKICGYARQKQGQVPSRVPPKLASPPGPRPVKICRLVLVPPRSEERRVGKSVDLGGR